MDMDSVPKVKSFWERKEGFTGMLFGILGIGLVGWGLVTALPTLIALASGTITLVAMCVVLALMLMVVLDKRFWLLSWSMYQSLMRFITGIFVNIDPIGICKDYINQLVKKKDNINNELTNLKGQQESVTEAIATATDKMQKALAIAKEADKKGMADAVAINAREAERQKEFITKMQFILDKINMLYQMLSKVESNCETIIEDTRNQVQAKELERKMWKATSSAIHSASSILTGGADERALFEAGMESIQADIAHKNGELDRFVDVSKKIMDNIDLSNGVMQDKGMELLKQFESESGSILISDKDKKRILADTSFTVPTTKKKSTDVSAL